MPMPPHIAQLGYEDWLTMEELILAKTHHGVLLQHVTKSKQRAKCGLNGQAIGARLNRRGVTDRESLELDRALDAADTRRRRHHQLMASKGSA